jgi:class 3 adenylate cyclase/tetratricopeptide (TPR) repeat protein
MSATFSEAQWPVFRRAARTVVVVDLVESVRLIEQNEEDTVRRWQAFVGEAVTRLLPAHGGRLVKSLGDGLMVEFDTVPPAIQCAIAMHSTLDQTNQGRAQDRWMCLRVGAHVADVIVDERDIYGAGVNLAARLTSLAGPGEIVVSSAVRDRLVDGLDAEVEDLGACYLKHLSEPIQAYRLRSRQPGMPRQAGRRELPLIPTVAVIPFEGKGVAAPHDVLGELVAESIIATLSTSGDIRVISRLSTSALRSRTHSAEEIGALLGATFVLSGSYRLAGDRVNLIVELADARSQEVLWCEPFTHSFSGLLDDDSELVEAVCSRVIGAISVYELRRVKSLSLPSLEGFSLQLAGAARMHRSSRQEFDRGREVLEHLIERFPMAPVPRAWLAKWYVLRVTRGLVQDLSGESARALEQTRRAIESSPDCSLALAMEGFVYCHMLRDLDGADLRLDQALAVNPNDSLAWLFKCVVQGFRGEGNAAMASAERAIALSPLDPMRHYYDALAASAAVAAGRPQRAIELATRSLRVNRNHLPTLRALAVAQVESGDAASALQTGQRIMELEPAFTIRDYIARGPKGAEATRQRYAKGLSAAGIPQG